MVRIYIDPDETKNNGQRIAAELPERQELQPAAPAKNILTLVAEIVLPYPSQPKIEMIV